MSKKNTKKANTAKKVAQTTKQKRKTEKKIVVDLWRSDKMKKALFGVKKIEEIRAKSFQFSKDMRLFGEIKEEGKVEGYVGYRDILEKERVVIKLFTENWGWLGSLEEMTARGLTNSYSRRKSLPEYIVNLTKLNYLVEIEKVEGGFFNKESYAFSLPNDEAEVESFMINSKFGLGDDYNVESLQRGKIAIIDGKKFDIGGEFAIKIFDPELAKNRAFIGILILFAAGTKQFKHTEKRVKKALKEGKKNSKKLKVSSDEMKLYMNPRRVKM